MRYSALIGLSLLVTTSPHASTTATLDVVDDVPKFLHFYSEASPPGVTEQVRWDLWKKDYGIAAVPPTPQGDAMARKQLDAAWDKYAAEIPELASKESALETRSRKTLREVADLLGAEQPVHVKLVLFVGQFDGNAYSVPPQAPGQLPAVVQPVEDPDADMKVAHELTHAVHIQMAQLKNGFGAPLAETILMEGMAMHAAQALVPGHPDSYYVESQVRPAGWLEACTAKRAQVLRDVLPYLKQSGPDVGTRFTYGMGPSGITSEAYCAGWLLVGEMLKSGESYHSLARVPEAQMPDFVARKIGATTR